MKVIVCLDDRGGMMFNHRRQSRDRVLIEDVVSSLGGATLRIAPYSAPLFAESGVRAIVSEEFLAEAEEGDVCFVEDRAILPWREKLEGLVLYRWNRHYPADMTCDLAPEKNGLRLISSVDFAGSSHETITKEVYER